MKFVPLELSEEELKREKQEEAFYEAAHNIFGSDGVGIGWGSDDFGGNLYYVYVYDKNLKDTPFDSMVKKRFAGHETLVDELLPQIKGRRIASVHKKLGRAMDDLDVEDLAPLYEATGKKWRSKIRYRRSDAVTPFHISEVARLEKAELINGAIKRTPLKQFKPGRAKGYKKPVKPGEMQKLISDIQRAARSLRKSFGKGFRIHQTEIARALGYSGVHKLTYRLKKYVLNFDEVIAGI